MDPRTGEIHRFRDKFSFLKKEKELGHKLVPLTEKQAFDLEHLPKRRRIFLMKQKPCPCGSGKSFKKCCWRKYKKK